MRPEALPPLTRDSLYAPGTHTLMSFWATMTRLPVGYLMRVRYRDGKRVKMKTLGLLTHEGLEDGKLPKRLHAYVPEFIEYWDTTPEKVEAGNTDLTFLISYWAGKTKEKWNLFAIEPEHPVPNAKRAPDGVSRINKGIERAMTGFWLDMSIENHHVVPPFPRPFGFK